MKKTFKKILKKTLICAVSLLLMIDIVALPASAAVNSAAEAVMTPGSLVALGSYEQDNNPRNGAEPIVWIVLDYDASTDRSLLISRDILELIPFRSKQASGTGLSWSASDVRTWLNGDFMDQCFTRDEQSLICKVTNTTENFLGRPGGADTKDYFFLLSRQEANAYFSKDKDRRAELTEYAFDQAQKRGIEVTRNSTWWWLRSPGGHDFDGSVVDEAGAVTYGRDAKKPYGIRPAFWLDAGAVA